MRCPYSLVVAALLLVATGVNVRAQSVLSGGDNLGNALLYGRSAVVRHLGAEEHLNPMLIDVMNAQLDFDLPQLLTQALKCRDAAFKAAAVQTALYCNKVAQGAALDLGDAHTFFQIADWMKKFGFHAYNRIHSIPLHAFGDGLDKVNLQHLAKVTAPLSASLSNGSQIVPYVHSLTSVHEYELQHEGKAPTLDNVQLFLPTVQVAINGTYVAALVDTGTPTTIVMGKSTAGELGVTVLVTGVESMHSSTGPRPSARSGAFGLIKSLSFGSLTLHNVLVFITPDSQIPSEGGVIVGAPLLARFHSVTFGDSELLLNMGSIGCFHPLHMTFASSPDEHGRLIFAARAASKRVNASLDTGTVRALTASAKLAPAPYSRAPDDSTSASSQYFSRQVYYQPLQIFVGLVHFADSGAEIVPNMPPPVDVYLGAPLLTSADFTLNFGSKPSLCIVPRSRSP